MTVYIYQGHMGGLYVTEEDLDYEDLYCEQCGDSDYLELCTNDLQEVRNYLLTKVDLFDNGGYSVEDCDKVYRMCASILEEKL